MKKLGWESWGLLAIGLALVFASLRNWLAPGFLSIAGRYHSSRLDIALMLVAGLIFIIAAIRKVIRHHT